MKYQNSNGLPTSLHSVSFRLEDTNVSEAEESFLTDPSSLRSLGMTIECGRVILYFDM